MYSACIASFGAPMGKAMPLSMSATLRKLPVGLTITPDRLRQIRKERRPLGKYSSAQQVRYELRESAKIFKKYGVPHVDTTEFSIEEISSRILDSTGVDRRVRP